MLTKKIKFSDDTLSILKALEWKHDGTIATITETLDRKRYQEVNKALELLGGKWNRVLKGHIFQEDPRNKIEGFITDGFAVVEKDGYFPTPDPVVDLLINIFWDYDGITSQTISFLEPSAGTGAIIDGLIRRFDLGGFNIILIEKNAERCEFMKKKYDEHNKDLMKIYVINADFLECNKSYLGGFDLILMNPPFEDLQYIDHIKHAYSLLNMNGLLVAIAPPNQRIDKKSQTFNQFLKEHKAVIMPLDKGSFKSSGTMVESQIVILTK
jgi:16S rRNA G966 N2-methylase RsmD